MAQTVGTLLLDAIKTSGMVGRAQQAMANNPGVQAGAKVAQAGAGAFSAGPGGGGGLAKSLSSPLSGMMKTFMPGIGKMMPNIGKVFKQTIGLPGKLLSKGLGMLGINLSMSTLLRQSQLFTGILGALFQILGGFVDVILAPFMPLLVKVVQKLGAQIPKIREFAQKAYIWLETNFFPLVRQAASWVWDKVSEVVTWLKTFGDKVTGNLGSILALVQTVAQGAWDVLKAVFGWMKQNVWPVLKAIGETIWELIQFTWDWIKDTLWPGIKTAFGGLKVIIEGTLVWLKDTFLPLFKEVYQWFLKEIGGFFVWIINFAITNILQKLIPIIQSIFTQVVDILLNSILKPMWAAVEPFIKWWLEEWAKQWIWVWTMIDTKILPFVKSILDDFVPPVTRLIAAYMKDVAPLLTEYFALMREIAAAIMDLLLPLVKWILKGLWFFLEPLLKLVIKLVALMFKWIIIPILKLLLWVLRLPFTFRKEVLEPIQGWWERTLEELTFFGRFLKELPNIGRGILMQLWGTIFAKLGATMSGGPWGILDKIAKPFRTAGADLSGRGDNAFQGMRDLQRDMRNAASRRAWAGMGEAGYGGGGMNITINNISKEGMLDDTKNFVVDADEQRDIENMQNRDSDFGSYSSLSSGLVI